MATTAPRPPTARTRPPSATSTPGATASRGQRDDARPARRQGRGPRRDDQGRPADAARLHDHDRGLQRLLRRRRAAPRRPVGRRPRGGQARSSASTGKGFGDPANPLLVSVRSGAKFSMPGMMDTVLNLGLNEADARRGSSRSPATSASAGTPTAASSRCSGGSSWRSAASASTTPSRRPRQRHGAKQDTDLDAAALQRPRHASSRRSSRPTPAATSRTTRTSSSTSRSRRCSRQLVRQARPRLPQEPEHPRRPGHGRQRRDDGLRQHGRRLGHGRGLHPRPEHRREGPVRRVPDQRPGRGRRGRHPDGPEDRRDADRDARGLRRVPAHRPAARDALPRRPGPRVHDRARPAVHAPDPLARSGPRPRPCDRRRHGRGGHDHQGRGDRPDRAGPRRPAAARPVRPGRRCQAATRIAKGLNASPGRGRRAGRVQRRHRGRVGRARREGRPRPRSRPRPTTSTAWPWPRAS